MLLSHALRATEEKPYGIKFLNSYMNEANQSNYTFSNVNFGIPSDNREIVIVGQVRHTVSSAINSVSITGAPSVTVNSYTTPSPPIKLFSAIGVVNSLITSGTVTINTAGTADRCIIFVFAVHRPTINLTRTDSITGAVSSGATSYSSSALTANAGGFSVGILVRGGTTAGTSTGGIKLTPRVNPTEVTSTLEAWHYDNIANTASATPTFSITWSTSSSYGVYGASF